MWVGFEEQETKPGSREELSRETLKFTNITAADFGFPRLQTHKYETFLRWSGQWTPRG